MVIILGLSIWIVVGIIVFFNSEVSKCEYFLCWICLITQLIEKVINHCIKR